MTPNEELKKTMYALPSLNLQNRLMAAPDREIALSMMYMDDKDRAYLFSVLSAVKQKRIHEELALHARLRISYQQYRMALRSVMAVLTGTGVGGLKSYLKPVKYNL